MKYKINLERSGILLDGTGFSKHTMNSILNVILKKYYFFSEFDGEYLSIPYTDFYRVSKSYLEYITFLIDNGIIERNSKFKVGEFPKSFRFTKYFMERCIIDDVIFDKTDDHQGAIQNYGNLIIDKDVEGNIKKENLFRIIKG